MIFPPTYVIIGLMLLKIVFILIWDIRDSLFGVDKREFREKLFERI